MLELLDIHAGLAAGCGYWGVPSATPFHDNFNYSSCGKVFACCHILHRLPGQGHNNDFHNFSEMTDDHQIKSNR